MELYRLAEQIGTLLKSQGHTLVTAESCTGGWVAKAITDVAGSSAWFDCGFVTYSYEAKTHLLGVSPDLLETHGAVSAPVVSAMTQGALSASQATVAVSISGIAGPGGGTVAKPVGTVWLAWQWRDQPARTRCDRYEGDRNAVRRQAVHGALHGLLTLLHDGI